MPWNSLSPDGSKSVKQNTTPMSQNTTYIETNLNRDHFWNIGTDEDGHHKSINMENYADTSIGAPVDAPIATGMDGTMYLKTVAGTVQGFYRNDAGIYQFIPGFLSGTASINNLGFQTISAVPNNTFGDIWIFTTDSSAVLGKAYFKAAGGICQSFAVPAPSGLSTPFAFGNGASVSGLNITATCSVSLSAVYPYRIMYWAM